MKKYLFFLAAILACLFFPFNRAFSTGKIALTFDDGPTPECTLEILNTLHKYHARATFFVTGENARRYPEILKETFRAGHEIGNHTYNHWRLTEIGEKNIFQQISRTQNAVFEILGIWPRLFRPPFSARNIRIEAIANSFDLQMVLWMVSPADYEGPPAKTIAARVLAGIKPGSIVVMHDNCPNTPAAVEIILQQFEKNGFRSVTVSELEK